MVLIHSRATKFYSNSNKSKIKFKIKRAAILLPAIDLGAQSEMAEVVNKIERTQTPSVAKRVHYTPYPNRFIKGSIIPIASKEASRSLQASHTLQGFFHSPP